MAAQQSSTPKRPERLNTWVNGELKTIDLTTIWGETFAYWDTLVDADLAEKIANVVEHMLVRAARS